MSIEERLSKLNCKTQAFTDSAGGFGGMTVSDLCAAMAGVSAIGELIIRRKYIDPKEKGDGYYELIRESIFRVYDKDAQPKKKDMMQPLLNIALDDYCKTFQCPQCKGKGEVLLDTGQVHKCRSLRCSRGLVKRTDVQRAKALGVKAMDFRRLYRPAYSIIERYLTETLPECESRTLRKINKQANWRDYPDS